VIADPEDLRRGEARQRGVAGEPNEALAPHALIDLLALAVGPLVVPQNGRPQHLPPGVEQHGAVHLAAQSDPLDLLAADARVFERAAHRLDRGHPPLAWLLLRPAGSRGVTGVLGRGRADDASLLVDDEASHAGRADVNAEQIAH